MTLKWIANQSLTLDSLDMKLCMVLTKLYGQCENLSPLFQSLLLKKVVDLDETSSICAASYTHHT